MTVGFGLPLWTGGVASQLRFPVHRGSSFLNVCSATIFDATQHTTEARV